MARLGWLTRWLWKARWMPIRAMPGMTGRGRDGENSRNGQRSKTVVQASIWPRDGPGNQLAGAADWSDVP